MPKLMVVICLSSLAVMVCRGVVVVVAAAAAALAKPSSSVEEERELQFDLALCGSSFIFSTISNTIVTFTVCQKREENNTTKAHHYPPGYTRCVASRTFRVK